MHLSAAKCSIGRCVGTVLTDEYAVVRENVNYLLLHNGSQANGRAHIVGEDKERPSVRDHSTVERHRVHRRAHRMSLTPKWMFLPSGLLLGEMAAVLYFGLVARAEVPDPPHSDGTILGYFLNDLARHRACGRREEQSSVERNCLSKSAGISLFIIRFQRSAISGNSAQYFLKTGLPLVVIGL